MRRVPDKLEDMQEKPASREDERTRFFQDAQRLREKSQELRAASHALIQRLRDMRRVHDTAGAYNAHGE